METRTLPADVLFREEQQFRQPWLWLLLLLVSAGLILPLFSASNLWLGLLIILIDALLLGAFASLKLTTQVGQNGILIRFFPLSRQFIPLSQIKSYEACAYRPLKEYGGWGIRYGWKGKAYNVSGNRGVQLEFHDGKRLLIGSQRPEELAQAIERAIQAGMRIRLQ